jgi:hypothetical protein
VVDTIRRGGRKRKPRWLCPSMMDVIALAGTLRYREHRSVPEIHRELSRRGVVICERSVLLERYDEAASAGTAAHRVTLERQGRVIVAIFSRMLATRCCGSSATSCRGWFCWRPPCCRRHATILPAWCVRSRLTWSPSGFQSPAWSATAALCSLPIRHSSPSTVPNRSTAWDGMWYATSVVAK